jgi:hypothetical protein
MHCLFLLAGTIKTVLQTAGILPGAKGLLISSNGWKFNVDQLKINFSEYIEQIRTYF